MDSAAGNAQRSPGFERFGEELLHAPAGTGEDVGDAPAAEGRYSILHLSLEPVGRGGTRLTLSQHGVPRDCAKEIESNWHSCYWDNIKNMLSKANESAA